jgi:hypothetical protein
MALSQPYTAAGSQVFIAPSVATEPANAAAYAALTWVEIKGVMTIGEYGDEASTITASIIGDARVRKAKGPRDAGALSLSVAHWPDDPGQAALVAAEAQSGSVQYPIKVVVPNKVTSGGTNEIDYFMGQVASKRLNLGGNDTIVGRTFTINVNSAVTEVAPT